MEDFPDARPIAPTPRHRGAGAATAFAGLTDTFGTVERRLFGNLFGFLDFAFGLGDLLLVFFNLFP